MRGKRYPDELIERAIALCEEGRSDYEVARALAIPRSTVQNWRRNGPPKGGRRGAPARVPDWPPNETAYSYLLGLYLGDGWVTDYRSTTGLSLALDAEYGDIIDEALGAMQTCSPGPIGRLNPRSGSVRLYTYAQNWPALFPQHGPGKKHQRKIELVDWQLEITQRYTREFIRGLIHSDGSRCINRFSVRLPSGRVGRYAYPRYFFTNYSGDIRGIFCEHCELLGIRWSQSNPRNISVSHRPSVALLDSFVGPKS